MVFTAFLIGARNLEEVLENKPASSLVVSLSKALNGTHLLLCGIQMAGGPSALNSPQKALANHCGILPRKLYEHKIYEHSS